MIDLTFPLTAEVFVAAQEKLAGCKLDRDLRVITIKWVDILNDVYAEALAGGADFYYGTLEILDNGLLEDANWPDVVQCLNALKVWCCKAHQQGVKDAGKAAAREEREVEA